MKYSFCLVLLSLSALPACFASTGLDPDGCEPIAEPCGVWEEYASCEGQAACIEVPNCGGIAYCETESGPICTDPRPVCADGVEVSVCPGTSHCAFVEWCGGGFYCASESCNGTFPQCPAGETFSDIPCSGEAGCTALTGCDEGYYCRAEVDCSDPVFEPCMYASSTVWANGEGQCPDFDSDAYCYDTLYCGAERYCVTACAPGDTEVFHPSECTNPYDCYPSNPWRDDLPPSWCQGGGGPACRAIPTCEGGEEIPLDALCDDDGYCEYRSTCSTTIQCYFGIVLG